MNLTWNHFKNYYYYNSFHSFGLDFSRAPLEAPFLAEMKAKIQQAFDAMGSLEAGALANPDEKRMVGHYWLRDPKRSPTPEIASAIETAIAQVKQFAADIHSGKLHPKQHKKFQHLLVVGIGGSALGPQFLSHALASPHDPLDLYFFDNTDPDGMARVLEQIPDLSATIVVVISKSGGTKETRNGQLVAKAAFHERGLSLADHFVAITGDGSELYQTAMTEQWLKIFPMWDWVGGRTSQLSTVGLVPAALQGFDIEALLLGARRMDELTRVHEWRQNPAMILALCWYRLGSGKGTKDMVILPYKDRLELFSRYLQQLVMESLGKEKDLDGKDVYQGIAVYGNKGSTDQHAYVQQLREGVPNFFAVFIQVLRASRVQSLATNLEVERGITSADYLSGFYQGTRAALYEKGRESISLTIDEVSEETIGMLIALFERAVGLYASLIHVNAYHQPGVEAGKKAAASVLELQKKIVAALAHGEAHTVEAIAATVGADPEAVFHIVHALAENNRIQRHAGASFFESRYSR
jgi:glucose-6-phosphate isomerase